MKPRKKQYERSAETSTRILDAAQKLFADFGYEGVSMRAVAALAKVNLASIVYYFDSKQGLFSAVLTRFSPVLEAERERMLAIADANPSVEAYVSAFMEPAFRVMTDNKLGGRDFARLMWRLPHEPQLMVKEATKPYHNKIGQLFRDRIKQFCPNMSERDFSWHMHIVSSIFLATLGKCAEEKHWSRDIWIGDKDYILSRLVRTTCILLLDDQELPFGAAGSGCGTPLSNS